jgi:glycosyltransferase involved in cell wall biosynthesis
VGAEVVEVADEGRRPPGGPAWRSAANLVSDVRWTNLAMPRLAREHAVDVLHHPLPTHASGAEVPQVVTVHDLAFELHPEAFGRLWRRWASWTHQDAAVRAQAVVCVSAATARDAMEHWTLDPRKVVVAPHGPGQELPLLPSREPEHLLYVGDDEPRKELDVLAAAAARLPLPVVLAGAAEREGQRSVHRPDPRTLAELYAGAAALVHPSRHEGFGLTVLEAMRLGVPVVAARSQAVEELTAGAAVLVPPGDPDALARGVAEALARADELAAAGRVRADDFTWERSARAHLEAYAVALGR